MGDVKSFLIIDVPPGEAPEHVRSAWVGITLPSCEGRVMTRGVGVVSGPKSRLGHIVSSVTGRTTLEVGYRVLASTAVDILARTQPEAADWWRTNTPHLLKGEQYLVFDESVCRELPED